MGKRVCDMTQEQILNKKNTSAEYYKNIIRPKRKVFRFLKNPTKYIPVHVLAYTAGFLDGEGTVSLRMRFKNSKDFKEAVIQISMYNTKIEPLEFIKKYFGGSIYVRNRPQYSNTSEIQLRLSSKIENIYEFLFYVQPYLIIKKKHAKLLMEYCNIRINMMNVFGYKATRMGYTDRELEIVREFKTINKRNERTS